MRQKRDVDGCAGDEQSSHQPFWYRCSVCWRENISTFFNDDGFITSDDLFTKNVNNLIWIYQHTESSCRVLWNVSGHFGLKRIFCFVAVIYYDGKPGKKSFTKEEGLSIITHCKQEETTKWKCRQTSIWRTCYKMRGFQYARNNFK